VTLDVGLSHPRFQAVGKIGDTVTTGGRAYLQVNMDMDNNPTTGYCVGTGGYCKGHCHLNAFDCCTNYYYL
jgi:hypothetical protein